MEWAVRICYVQSLLLIVLSRIRETTGDTYMPRPYGNLSCHECYYSMHRANCLTLRYPTNLYSICRDDEKYCMVERYSFDGERQTFSRKCAKQCQPGCHKAGVNIIVEKCFSCCTTNFCNVDNGAADVISGSVTSLRSLALALALFHCGGVVIS